ncbi:MAG: hypothetical protein MJK10_22275 [Pseudomonadales bacterium]|nr:hypothetical protein [Pseudomonadales bacterium]NRA14879.1 hypothetical protein [Oceanospirillaceae bacterium]
MKNSLLIKIVILLTLSITGCADLKKGKMFNDINVTGSWSGNWQTKDGTYTESFKLDLIQNNNKISGTGLDEHGSSAAITGHLIQKEVELKIWNNQGTGVFVGLLNNNQITGTWVSENRSGPFQIIRKKAGISFASAKELCKKFTRPGNSQNIGEEVLAKGQIKNC